MRPITLIAVFVLLAFFPKAQYVAVDTLNSEFYNRIVYFTQEDTVVSVSWAGVSIEAVATNRARKKQYDRLAQKVIKAYPYAWAAGEAMRQCEAQFQVVQNEHERKEMLDLAEDEMKLQFEKDLRKLTISEGVILIKLVDRETGDVSYELIKELKGKFSAFMWQSVARLFGHNLKDEYDEAGEDLWIENIVQQIENGDIPVQLPHVDVFRSTYTGNR